MRPLVLTAGLIAVAGIVVCLVAIWREFQPMWSTADYTARHRAAGRVSWLAEFRLHVGRLHDRAKRAAYLRLMVIPAMVEVPSWPELPAAGDDFDRQAIGGAGRYAHLRTDELDATAERVQMLVARGIRPVSPWGTPEVDDVWEPDLVGAR